MASYQQGRGKGKPKGAKANNSSKRPQDSVREDRDPKNKFSNNTRIAESALMKAAHASGKATSRAPRECENDPAWYTSAIDLRTSYFQYPFNAPLGMPFQSQDPNFDRSSVPGVMAYYYVPTVGVSTSATSAINVAAQRVYSFVRHQNSGHANYDPSDLMIYILAMDSLEMYAAYLQRIYGLLLKYTPTNWYSPEALLKANYVNPDDLSRHIPDLLGYIKLFVAKTSALAVPANVSYNARHAWLTSHLWVDSKDSSKAQTYMFVPQSYYKFDLAPTDSSGMLRQTRLFDVAANIGTVQTTNLLTFDQLVTFGNDLLNAVLAQEDFGIMSGDIMKAYPNNYRVITMVPDDYVVPFEYSEEVMSQIENATVWSGLTHANVIQQIPDPGVKAGWLEAEPFVEAYLYFTENTLVTEQSFQDSTAAALKSVFHAGYNSTARKMLNFHHDNPSADDVAVATRLMSQWSWVDLSKPNAFARHVDQRSSGYPTWVVTMPIDSCGSEVIVGARMFFNYQESTTKPYALYAYDVPSVMPISVKFRGSSSTGGDLLTGIRMVTARLEQLATFDWHHGVMVGALVWSEKTLGGGQWFVDGQGVGGGR